MKITEDEKRHILTVAQTKLFNKGNVPVNFELDMVLVVGLIGQLQLAFRHPFNLGPTRQMLEGFVRELIERLDPEKKEIYQFLMMGFDEVHDE